MVCPFYYLIGQNKLSIPKFRFFHLSTISLESLIRFRRFFLNWWQFHYFFVLKKKLFKKHSKFCIIDRFRPSIRISIFFEKFKICSDYSFIIWKGNDIVIKNIMEIWPRVTEISDFKELYHLNFVTCGFRKLICDHWDWVHKWAPIFVLCVIFLLWKETNGLIYHKEYWHCYFGKSTFHPILHYCQFY